MIRRVQPPVRSPLSASALLRGAAALVWPGRARDDLLRFMMARLGADHGVLTDSGTSALQLALRFAAPGRPVALPAWSCFDLATAAIGADARVALYDLDPTTLAPDMDSLRAALAAGAGAVVVAHLFGLPQPMLEIAALAAAAGATVIEDAAQAAGGTQGGVALGGFGPLTVLSFGRGKGLTGGGGGALLGRGDAARRVTDLARHALAPAGRGAGKLAVAAAQWAVGRPALYALPASLPFLRLGETVFHPPHAPRGMADAPAAATHACVPLADIEVAVRRRNAARLLTAVTSQFTAVRLPAGAVPGWLRLPLLASETAAVAARTRSARKLGVAPSYPLVLADLPGFGVRCLNADRAFAGARTLASRLVTLPTHSRLTSRDLDALAAWMHQW